MTVYGCLCVAAKKTSPLNRTSRRGESTKHTGLDASLDASRGIHHKAQRKSFRSGQRVKG